MSFKVPVCCRDAYTVYLQTIDGTVWAHCDVREWSPAVARSLRRDVDALHSMQAGPVFAMNEPPGDPKHQKFLALMGFKFHTNLPGKTGMIPIYRRA